MEERKRVLLLILIGMASFYGGYILFRDETVIRWFRYAGYWCMVATVACFLYLLYRAYWQFWPRIRAYFCSSVGKMGLLTVALGSVFLFRAEPLGFKTIMDEHVLAGTGKYMHETREVYTASRILSANGFPRLLGGFVDKRPILQPFLVSVVHDLTGYRPLNGVYLNVVLTPFMLLLLYVFTERIGGTGAGIGAVALFCSLPLLSYMCAGGGLQPLNLFFILLTCLLGGFYLQDPDRWRLGALIFSGILLAQCRYESVLFILPVGLIVIWSWMMRRRLLVPWTLILCPLLLVPSLWQHRVFRVAKFLWQMDGDLEPFGLQYMYDNFGRAAGFAFNFGGRQSNSWLLVAVGVVALLLLLVSGVRHWRSLNTLSPQMQAGILFLPGFLLLFVLLLGYGWEFDSPVIVRLSLPLHIPLAVAGAYLFFSYLRNRYVRRTAAAMLVVYFLAYAFPTTSRRIYAQTYLVGKEFRLAEKFLLQHADERMLVVADDAVFFSLYGVDVLSTDLANTSKASLKFYISQPASPPVYYFRRLIYSPTTHTFEPNTNGRLDEDFVTEPAWDMPYSELRKVEVVRVVDVKNIEIEEPEYKNIVDYIKFWGKNLP